VIAGCGGSDGQQAAPRTLPSCAREAKVIPRPKALPGKFPVPPGTVFAKAEKPFPQQHIFTGVSPGSLVSTRSFYGAELEKAGYQEAGGEFEPGEVEALFTGGGVRGGWRANELPNCDGAVRLTLVIVSG
jgi:hypothetical protein